MVLQFVNLQLRFEVRFDRFHLERDPFEGRDNHVVFHLLLKAESLYLPSDFGAQRVDVGAKRSLASVTRLFDNSSTDSGASTANARAIIRVSVMALPSFHAENPCHDWPRVKYPRLHAHALLCDARQISPSGLDRRWTPEASSTQAHATERFPRLADQA